MGIRGLLVACLLTLAFINCIEAQGNDDSSESYGIILNVMFIYDGIIGDYGYNYAFDQARLQLEVNYNYTVYCNYTIVNSSNTASSIAAIELAIPMGYDLIITTSSDLHDQTNTIAARHPNVTFLMAGGSSKLKNVGIYQGLFNDARWLTGIVAGLKTKTDIICFISSWRYSFLVNGFNAWIHGAREVNKNVTGLIAFVDSWSDPAAEIEATKLMISKGCDVINAQVNDIEWEQYAASKGVFSIGFNSDIRIMIGETVLTSVMSDYVKIFTQFINSIFDHTFNASDIQYDTLANGGILLTPYGSPVTFSQRKRVNNYKTFLNESNFFCGPIYATKSCNFSSCYDDPRLLLPAGQCMDNWNLTSYPAFLIDNVVDLGSIKAPVQAGTGPSITVVHDRINSGALAGIIVGVIVAVVIVAAFTMFKVKQNRTAAVIALKQVEEGQKKNYKILYNKLKLGRLIGTGNFGEVFMGEYHGTEVAVKKLKTQDLKKQQIDEFAQEVSVMVGLRHPNIVLLMGACTDTPNLCIVTEFMPQGSLFAVLHNERIQFSPATIKSMILDMLKGLQFIHSVGMLHRDLKSPNLLVDKRGTIKLADFGLSILQSNSTEQMVHMSVPWTAPEIFSAQPYTPKADVYSAGVICWELITRKIPFYDMLPAAIPRAVVHGRRPELPLSEVLPGLGKLIQGCWAHNPNDRPEISELRAHIEQIYVTEEGGDFALGSNSHSSNTNTKSSGSSSDISTAAISLPAVPAPPEGIVACVYVEVYNSQILWDWNPYIMAKSLKIFGSTVNLLLFKHRGFLSTDDSDAFLLIFQEVVDATNFAIEIHLELLKQIWPQSLLTHPDAGPQELVEGLMWKGLHCKVAVHTGGVQSTAGLQAEQVFYTGNPVDLAVKLGKLAQSGQSLITEAVYRRIQSQKRLITNITVVDLHTRPIPLYHITHNNIVSIVPSPEIAVFDDIAPPIPPYEILNKTKRWIIPLRDIQMKQKLGGGNFGDTFMASLYGKDVAVKIFPIRSLPYKHRLELCTDAILLTGLHHNNITKVYGLIMQDKFGVVQDFVPRGSLANILWTPSIELSLDRKISFAMDMAAGMVYLHSKDILHHDMKPNNFLVTEDWRIKISDLGFMRVKTQHQTMTQSSMVSWTAPEIFDGEKYTPKSEVYSFGIMLWEILTRQKAWEGLHAIRIANSVSQGQRPNISDIMASDPVTMELVRLIIMCWNPRPEERPNFQTVLEILQKSRR